VFPNWTHAREAADNTARLAELEKALRHHLTKNRLANVWAAKERFQKVLEGRTGRVIKNIRRFLAETLGNPEFEDVRMQAEWTTLMAELSRVLGLGTHLAALREGCGRVEASGAPQYATSLKQSLEGTVDGLLPDNWRNAWRLRRLATYLESIDPQEELKRLERSRHEVGSDLSRAYRDIVVKRTWLKLAENASPSIRAALQAYLNAIQKIGKDKGKGKRAVRFRQDARMAASQANPAVPCWIMPHYRVSESLPAELGCFDLVVIDEASQSDLMALPSLLRAKKVLIVGDDKQVSPEGVGLEEEKIRSLMNRFLGNQVETYRPQMAPNNSIYDLFKVVFAKSAVMLKEHFRCVGPIIEYSKREFYHHELRPLRMPKASERLDPPLIDVVVEDGYSEGHVNAAEARFIVNEIKAIVADPNMRGRSIGVVSLLADKQAIFIWERLTDQLGPELMQRHRIACGDARTFQGKERDIMFLSMVSAPNYVGGTLSGIMYDQRFNVAASRARDRMYLVRSVGPDHLSEADRLRRGLIKHFAAPFAQDEVRAEDLRNLCESPFEREMYDELTQRGYWVTPQVRVGQYRIDIVVEGHNDARLAVECDGDKYHGADKWADDMQRQRVLERAGWVFWRCFASAFILRRKEVLEDLLMTLAERGIEPIGAEGAPRSVHTEHRVVSSLIEPAVGQVTVMPVEVVESAQASIPEAPPVRTSSARGDASSIARLYPSVGDGNVYGRARLIVSSIKSRDANLPFSDYVEYAGPIGNDPRSATEHGVSEGIVRIVEVEGPVVAKRAYDIYLRGCGIKRMGHELKSTMNKALSHAIRQGRVICEDEAGKSGILFSVVRVTGSPPIRLRTRGPRSFEELPPSELQVVAKYLLERHGFPSGSKEHLHAVLECFDLKRLTTQVGTTLLEVMERSFPYVDELLSGVLKMAD
jgi:very-short-patch-repair endonuclease